KACLKWDVEGDENSKFFHGIIKSKRKSQMINRILNEGVCIADPNDIKTAFLNFYKEKFSCLDSSMSFPPVVATKRLGDSDHSYLDSMVSLEEIKDAVWECGSKKAPGRDEKDDVLKVDFEKAFDSVSWHFLDYIMEILGFSHQWRRWINARLVSSRASILVNGSPTSEFSLKRGLRQGDPLSPFLFIMVMERLNIMLKDGLAANPFRGVKIVSPCFHLLHLFYADDVIIFSEWNQCDMENIIHIPDEVAQMANGMGCSSSSFPFTYLGLPIGSNMGRISNWSILSDQLKVRLSGWKANMLSAGVVKEIHGGEVGFELLSSQSSGV
nr:reverse transcriptase domain, reverse transcriptase zinc-binding domain protein [Tanacetum cinerariifolium]